MLKEVRPDAVSICTPNGVHAQPQRDFFQWQIQLLRQHFIHWIKFLHPSRRRKHRALAGWIHILRETNVNTATLFPSSAGAISSINQLYPCLNAHNISTCICARSAPASARIFSICVCNFAPFFRPFTHARHQSHTLIRLHLSGNFLHCVQQTISFPRNHKIFRQMLAQLDEMEIPAARNAGSDLYRSIAFQREDFPFSLPRSGIFNPR